MKRRRVKITGIGPVTPAGTGTAAFGAGIVEAKSRVIAVKRFEEAAGAFVAAEVKGFHCKDHFPELNPRRLSRHTQFALAAAKLALADAGLTFADAQDGASLVMVGASLVDSDLVAKAVQTVAEKGPRFGNPRMFHTSSVLAIGVAIVEQIGDHARTMAIQGACCSGIDAIGQAAERVATGESDLAICGGSEAPVFYHPMLELKMAGLAPGNPERPERQCRPFDLWRTTGVIGEGACLFVLEPEESPRPGYAWVDGYSFTNNPPGDDSEGLERAIRFTLANAHTSIAEVDAISAWGPGHRQLDAAEAVSLRRIFGSRLDEIPIASIKGAIGNPLAAAGAIQVGAALLGMRRGFIPPTVNWEFPDPTCPLNLSAVARWLPSGVTLINGHGLLGTNSCLLLRRC